MKKKTGWLQPKKKKKTPLKIQFEHSNIFKNAIFFPTQLKKYTFKYLGAVPDTIYQITEE